MLDKLKCLLFGHTKEATHEWQRINRSLAFVEGLTDPRSGYRQDVIIGDRLELDKMDIDVWRVCQRCKAVYLSDE